MSLEKRGPATKRAKSRVRADMRASVCEGLFAQAFLNIAGPWSVFVTALVLSLGAGGKALAFVFSAGPIMMAAQLLGPALLPVFGGSRRTFVIAAATAGRVLFLAVPVIIFLLPAREALIFFITLFLASQIFLGMATNVWTAWIGATVPARVRGAFLGKRTQLVTAFGLTVAFGASIFKDAASPAGRGIAGFLTRAFHDAKPIFGPEGERWAFAVIFATAAALGLVSSFLLRRQGDRKAEAAEFKVSDLAVPLADGSFRRLLFFFAVWFFAIYFGAPFWQPFFIEVLGMSLTAIQFYSLVFVVAMAASSATLGRALDRFGNKPVLRAMMLLSVGNAFVYVFMTPQSYWWIWIEAVTSGVMWGGANVATTNLIIQLSPAGRRDAYVAAFAVLTGLFGFLGTHASGLLVASLPFNVTLWRWPMVNMQVAFLITAALRVVAQLPMYAVREPKAIAFREMVRVAARDVGLWFLRWVPTFKK